MERRYFTQLLVVGALVAALPGGALAQQSQVIKIGATPGPHAQILEAVKPIAAKNGLDIQIVEFSDYVVPNAAFRDREVRPALVVCCSSLRARCSSQFTGLMGSWRFIPGISPRRFA